MTVQSNGNHTPTLTASGIGVDPGEAVLRTILPKVLDAVGNGYNHVESRLNEIQNQRLPSLEAQFQAFEQSHAQVKGTNSQILSLKERLDAAEAKEASLETLGQKWSSNSTRNAASIQSLSTKIDKLQADHKHSRDVARSFEPIPPGFEWASISSALDSVKMLSAKVEQFQREKETDSRTIQNLSNTVKKLQAERDTDADRIHAQSERLDNLQSQVGDGEQASKLEAISQHLEKLQADRELDSSRLQKTSENLNKLQSQQAEKASRLTLNVLNEKVARIQAHYERDRTADAEALVKKHSRKFEDRLDQTDKQLKQLSEQSRRTETVHSGIAGLNGAIPALVSRVEMLESRQSNAASSNTPINSLFMRVDKLESRDASIARVNADSQTLLKRVEKLAGDHSNIARVGASLQALEKRVENIDRRATAVDRGFLKTDVDVSALENRLQQWMKMEPKIQARLDKLERVDSPDLGAKVDNLVIRLKAVESQKHAELSTLVARLNGLEDRYAPVARRTAETDHLLELIGARLQDQNESGPSRETKASDLISRIKILEDQKDRQIRHELPDIEKLGANLKELVKRIQDLETSKSTITTDMANIDYSITLFGRRMNDLERQPDLSHLVDKVRVRVEALESQYKYKNNTSLHAGLETLRVRVDVLESLINMGVEAPLLTTNDVAIPKGHDFDHKTSKVIDSSARAASTASADVISAKESIERPSTRHSKQKQQKSSRTRSSEQTHQVERKAHSDESSLKRTFDMSSQDNDAEQVKAGSHKRSRSEVAKTRPSIARISTGQSLSLRQNARGRHAASSPVENARSASRRKVAVQNVGATDEGDSEEHEESEDEIAPRRTSRTVKPTERGSHLTFLDATAKKTS